MTVNPPGGYPEIATKVASGLTWTVAGRSPIAVYAFIGALGTVWLVSFIGRLTGRHHITDESERDEQDI